MLGGFATTGAVPTLPTRFLCSGCPRVPVYLNCYVQNTGLASECWKYPVGIVYSTTRLPGFHFNTSGTWCGQNGCVEIYMQSSSEPLSGMVEDVLRTVFVCYCQAPPPGDFPQRLTAITQIFFGFGDSSGLWSPGHGYYDCSIAAKGGFVAEAIAPNPAISGESSIYDPNYGGNGLSQNPCCNVTGCCPDLGCSCATCHGVTGTGISVTIVPQPA
jgi:hypothetical protein